MQEKWGGIGTSKTGSQLHIVRSAIRRSFWSTRYESFTYCLEYHNSIKWNHLHSGHNGAGKTTTMKVITAEEAPTHGRVCTNFLHISVTVYVKINMGLGASSWPRHNFQPI